MSADGRKCGCERKKYKVAHYLSNLLDVLLIFIILQWRASANQVAVSVHIIDTCTRRPEFVCLDPWSGVATHFLRVRTVPGFRNQVIHSMRGSMKSRLFVLDTAISNVINFLSDRQHGIAESVQFLQVLRLGGFDHESTRYGPRHGGRMETVVLETLSNILLSDTSGSLQRTKIQNELVRALSVSPDEQDIVSTTQPSSHVICVQNCLPSSQLEARLAQHFNVHPRDGKDGSGSKGSTSNGTTLLWHANFATAKFTRGFRAGHVPWQVRGKVGRDTNGSNTCKYKKQE
jgi:hypothetical protein